MYARVTQLEMDTLRISVDQAEDLFRQYVLPELRRQPGYQGVIVLSTPEGKGLLVSFWASAEEADARSAEGFYAEQLERYFTLFRSPPGRERYRLAFAELPPVESDGG
jgi:hypothetical protein